VTGEGQGERSPSRRYDRPSYLKWLFPLRPEVVIMVPAARVLSQVLACVAYRQARPAGGCADVGHRREQGVLPVVVGLPPGNPIKWGWFGPALEGCCGQHRVWELRALPTSERALGQEPPRHSSKGRGSPTETAVDLCLTSALTSLEERSRSLIKSRCSVGPDGGEP
jgi:hypothetical protein